MYKIQCWAFVSFAWLSVSCNIPLCQLNFSKGYEGSLKLFQEKKSSVFSLDLFPLWSELWLKWSQFQLTKAIISLQFCKVFGNFLHSIRFDSLKLKYLTKHLFFWYMQSRERSENVALCLRSRNKAESHIRTHNNSSLQSPCILFALNNNLLNEENKYANSKWPR